MFTLGFEWLLKSQFAFEIDKMNHGIILNQTLGHRLLWKLPSNTQIQKEKKQNSQKAFHIQ
jgi:hypothetical protein